MVLPDGTEVSRLLFEIRLFQIVLFGICARMVVFFWRFWPIFIYIIFSGRRAIHIVGVVPPLMELLLSVVIPLVFCVPRLHGVHPVLVEPLIHPLSVLWGR